MPRSGDNFAPVGDNFATVGDHFAASVEHFVTVQLSTSPRWVEHFAPVVQTFVIAAKR